MSRHQHKLTANQLLSSMSIRQGAYGMIKVANSPGLHHTGPVYQVGLEHISFYLPLWFVSNNR